jgi:hypothetical protein
LNQEVTNDIAKLIMHRLVSRALAHDVSLLVEATTAQTALAERFAGKAFIHAWNDLLARPIQQLRSSIASRSREMNRLRLSSPFATLDRAGFTDLATRRRIWAAARRLALRRASVQDAELGIRPTVA